MGGDRKAHGFGQGAGGIGLQQRGGEVVVDGLRHGHWLCFIAWRRRSSAIRIRDLIVPRGQIGHLRDFAVAEIAKIGAFYQVFLFVGQRGQGFTQLGHLLLQGDDLVLVRFGLWPPSPGLRALGGALCAACRSGGCARW